MDKNSIGHLQDQIITAKLRSESRHREKVQDEDGRCWERDVVDFELQKHLKVGEQQQFYPVWATGPVLTLEVSAYYLLLKVALNDETKARAAEWQDDWRYFKNWEQMLEARQQLQASGATIKCRLFGKVRKVDRNQAKLNPGFGRCDREFPLAGGSIVWMMYDVEKACSVVTEISSHFPAKQILALDEQVFRAKTSEPLDKAWLELMLG